MIVCKPEDTCDCGGELKLRKKHWKHQVYEIPRPTFEVFEYQVYRGDCTCCQKRHYGSLPSGVTGKGYGANTHALISLMTSKYRLSKRQAQQFLRDCFGMPVSLGSVSNVENTVTQSLEKVHDELKSAVQSAPILHLDETGYRQKNQNGWAWLAVSPAVSLFILRDSRGRKIARELVGHCLQRIFVTDRYKAYDYLPEQAHQVCWAHLKRDFQKIAERSGQPGEVGRELLRLLKKIFGCWKTELKEQPPLLRKQKKRIQRLKRRLIATLTLGAGSSHKQTARTCENILNCGQSLWRFLEVPGVPPTNNLAERQLRPLVITKKLTFGTQSQRGNRYIERIFSVIMTCAQLKKNPFPLLQQVISAFFSAQPPPLILA